MQIALTHNHFDASHLESVKSEMMTLGAPVIKAVWMECFGFWVAIEGCHRIRAAKDLGITPEIEAVEYSDDLAPGAEDGLTIAQICDSAHNSEVVDFD